MKIRKIVAECYRKAKRIWNEGVLAPHVEWSSITIENTKVGHHINCPTTYQYNQAL